MAAFTRCLAETMGLSTQVCDELFLAATLHDIGKIAIPDAVLRKEGALHQDERRVIQSHTVIGHHILSNREFAITRYLPRGLNWGDQPQLMKVAAEIARSHHEWWNGTGYPDKLKGEEIPLPARIVGVADVLDALRSTRPYKAAYDWATAMQIIAEVRGIQFDPAVHDALLAAEDELYEFDQDARKDEMACIKEAA